MTQSMEWAVNTSITWAKHKSTQDGDKKNFYPIDLLEKEYLPAAVCSFFILEARRTDVSKYPAKTPYLVLCGLP